MCYVRHRVGIGGCVFHSVNIYISINNLLFLNPAHRSQDALRQRRDGVKEDYYV